MSIKKDFGKRVKEIRTKKGITQYNLAELVNIDPKHISHIETGGSFPKADLIEKLAEALNIDYLEFFKIEHLKPRKQILNKINEMLNSCPDEDLKKIYRVISCLVN